MDNVSVRRQARSVMTALLMVAAIAHAQGDPPARVGRIAALSGEVWLFDTESRDWVAATRNRPLTQGDRLAVSTGGSAELQVGASALMLDADTEIEATRLDDERLQFALLRGSLGLRQHEAELPSQPEVFTPEARFQPLRAGWYRIDRRADSSSATNWRGLLRATTRDEVLTLEPGRRLELGPEVAGGSLPLRWSAPASDAFSTAFLREVELAVAAPEFVSPEMTGVAELARHGSWQQHPEFGWAWSPAVVPAQWAPYRFGQWVWMSPWGWTWVDAAPWGFAPFHYGRWFAWGERWYWTPGPQRVRPVYAPALIGVPPPVAIGGGRPPRPLGWAPPLGPRDPFRPGYRVSPGYVDRVNPIGPAPRPKPPPSRPLPMPDATPPATGPFHGRPVNPKPPDAPRESLPRQVSPPVPVAAAPAPAKPQAAQPFVPKKEVAAPPPRNDPDDRRRGPDPRAPGRER